MSDPANVAAVPKINDGGSCVVAVADTSAATTKVTIFSVAAFCFFCVAVNVFGAVPVARVFGFTLAIAAIKDDCTHGFVFGTIYFAAAGIGRCCPCGSSCLASWSSVVGYFYDIDSSLSILSSSGKIAEALAKSSMSLLKDQPSSSCATSLLLPSTSLPPAWRPSLPVSCLPE
jgi:hypothetical protein